MFQQSVPESGKVLALGAGNCEFSNTIRAREVVESPLDLNPQTKAFRRPWCGGPADVPTHRSTPSDGGVDTLIGSEFFEHLPTKELLIETLSESWRKSNLKGKSCSGRRHYLFATLNFVAEVSEPRCAVRRATWLEGHRGSVA